MRPCALILVHAVLWAGGLLTALEPVAGAESASALGASEHWQWRFRAEREIHFEADSSALTSADEHDLRLIARAAQIHNDYSLSVVGFSRVPGSGAGEITHRRVTAVIKFLERSGDVPPGRIVTGSGSSDGPATVTVRVLARVTRQ